MKKDILKSAKSEFQGLLAPPYKGTKKIIKKGKREKSTSQEIEELPTAKIIPTLRLFWLIVKGFSLDLQGWYHSKRHNHVRF